MLNERGPPAGFVPSPMLRASRARADLSDRLFPLALSDGDTIFSFCALDEMLDGALARCTAQLMPCL